MPKLFLTLFIPLILFGSFDRIRKAIEKRDFEKAEELIIKGLVKDPDNPGNFYWKSALFFNLNYPKRNIDSARVFIQNAQNLLNNVDNELRLDLVDDGISEKLMDSLGREIENELYARTLLNLSLASIDSFKIWYPNTIYLRVLEAKIDSIKYYNVFQQNEITLYRKYKAERPASIYLPKVDSLINLLLYQDLKQTQSLSSYYSFLEKYPNSPYRYPIEEFILTNSTGANKYSNYVAFIELAGSERLRRKAADIIYHLKDSIISRMPDHYIDSLNKVSGLDRVKVFPYINSGKIGLASLKGEILAQPGWDYVDERHKCQVESKDLIFLTRDNHRFLTNKAGDIIASAVQEYEDIGLGVLKIKEENGKFNLIHKSGYSIIKELVDDAKIVGNRWIKVKRNSKWGLISHLNYPVTPVEFQDIRYEEGIWVFKKFNLYAILTSSLLDNSLKNNELPLNFQFEDIEFLESSIIGYNGDDECLLNYDLDNIIPWGKYSVNPSGSDWYIKHDSGYQFYNHASNSISENIYRYIEINEGWQALKTKNDWLLISKTDDLQPSRGYDSLKLVNPFVVIAFAGEKSEIILKNEKRIALSPSNKVRLIHQNVAHFYVEEGRKKTLYNAEGNKIFSLTLDQINYFNDSLMIVKKDRKYGLMTLDGDLLLPISYDFMDQQYGLLQLLNNNKIGCYEVASATYVKPDYSSRIQKIGSYFKVGKHNKIGLINESQKLVLDFEFDEIQYWNDTSFLVRKDDLFSIVGRDATYFLQDLESLSLLSVTDSTSSWKYGTEGKYGLINSEEGTILRAEFTDITNIGTDNEPFYFCEQNLQTANFHVVSYINKTGSLVMSQAYTREEFNRIYCEDY